MREETVQVKRQALVIKTLADAQELLKWAKEPEQKGIYATVAVRVDGSIYIEVGGITADTHSITIGDGQSAKVIWDGHHFAIEATEG